MTVFKSTSVSGLLLIKVERHVKPKILLGQYGKTSGTPQPFPHTYDYTYWELLNTHVGLFFFGRLGPLEEIM